MLNSVDLLAFYFSLGQSPPTTPSADTHVLSS